MSAHSSRYHLAIFSRFSQFSPRTFVAASSSFWLLCCFALCSACATAPQLRTTAPLAAGTNTELAVGVVGAGGFAQVGGGGALAGRFRIDDRSELTFSANAVADVGWRDLSEGPEPLIPLRTGYRGLLYSGTVAMRYNFTKIDDTYFGGEVGINFFDDTGASLNRYQIGGQIGLPLLVDLYDTGIFVYALPTLGAVIPLLGCPQHTQQDPFGDRHPVRLHFALKRLRNVVRHKAQPISHMRFDGAWYTSGCGY